jgi:two-component system sensor kinase FixL
MPNFVEALWIGIISVCALLAAIHAMTWWLWRQGRDHLLLSALCVTVAFTGYFELAAMSASDVAAYAEAFRVGNLMVVPLVAATVLYTLSIAPGRRWLGAAVILTRLVAHIGAAASGEGLPYAQIVALSPVTTPWGDVIQSAVGVNSPWLALGMLSNLLLLAFLMDVVLGIAREPHSPERRRRFRVIVAVSVFVASLVLWRAAASVLGLSLPFVIAPTFAVVVLILSVDVSNELLRAARLAQMLDTAETHLRQNQRDIHIVEEAGGLAMWKWYPGASEVEISERGRTLTGLRPGAAFVLAEQVERLDWRQRLVAQSAVAELIACKTDTLALELKYTHEDGTSRWISVHGQGEYSAEGALECIHGAAFDVTASRGIGEQFEVVVATSPNAILLVGEDGKILMANEAAVSLTGYALDELVGSPMDRLVPLHYRPRHAADRSEYMVAGGRRKMSPRRDVLLARKDGSEIQVEVALNMTTVNGKRWVVASVTDLSERFAMNREIGDQRKMLAHLSRVALLSELSGSLAHEISQPLTTILSNAQASARFLDRDTPDLKEVRDGLGEIIDSTKRAGEVIRRLRSMLRKEMAEFAVVDVLDVVNGVHHLLRSDLIGRGVAFSVDVADAVPQVRADPVQLQQVLMNLLLNACDAMADQPRPHSIRVTLAPAEQGVLVNVSDSGPGIPDDDLERVFQTFHSTKDHGLGFGLALCRSLVSAHGGRIWASNNPDGGATFHVYLPAADSHAA